MSQDASIPPDSPASPARGWLRQAWREAEHWPLAGQARRMTEAAEARALGQLKQRLDAMADTSVADPDEAGPDTALPPEQMLADLLVRERSVDPDRARRELYRRVLGQLVPDQISILRVLDKRGVGTLCHIGVSRLPGGPVSSLCLENASSLGQEAGVLLREFTPYYMQHLLQLGLVIAGSADRRLEADYELLLADPNVRAVMDDIRERLRGYPRVLRHAVTLSPLGAALWRDCYPAAQAIAKRRWP